MTPIVPDGLEAQIVYEPLAISHGGLPDDPWVVHLLDRRSMRTSQILLSAGLAAMGLGAFVLNSWLLGCVGLLAALMSFPLQLIVGRSGYYPIQPDGTLGDRLPRAEVNMARRHRYRILDGELIPAPPSRTVR